MHYDQRNNTILETLVYYNFDTKVTKGLLFEVIMKIESVGFPVVAMVCDMGPTNITLWNSLNIGIKNYSFKNPSASDREIHVFADAPHLIKLVRNNFLDSGFELQNGHFVQSGCVKEIIQRSKGDLKPTYRLTE